MGAKFNFAVQILRCTPCAIAQYSDRRSRRTFVRQKLQFVTFLLNERYCTSTDEVQLRKLSFRSWKYVIGCLSSFATYRLYCTVSRAHDSFFSFFHSFLRFFVGWGRKDERTNQVSSSLMEVFDVTDIDPITFQFLTQTYQHSTHRKF